MQFYRQFLIIGLTVLSLIFAPVHRASAFGVTMENTSIGLISIILGIGIGYYWGHNKVDPSPSPASDGQNPNDNKELIPETTEDTQKRSIIPNDDTEIYHETRLTISDNPEPVVQPQPYLNKLSFAAVPTIKSPMKLIATTKLGDSVQTLEYVITNDGTTPIKDMVVDGFDFPIERSTNIDSTRLPNCESTLQAQQSCTIKLLVKPPRARKILQNLTVTALDINNQPLKINSPINIEVMYEPYVLITRDRVKFEEKFNFTFPILINEIDELAVSADRVLFDANVTNFYNSRAAWYHDEDGDKWEFLSDYTDMEERLKEIHFVDDDFYIIGDRMYIVFSGYSNVEKINIKYSSSKVLLNYKNGKDGYWRSLPGVKLGKKNYYEKKITGVRKIGNRIYLAGEEGLECVNEIKDFFKDKFGSRRFDYFIDNKIILYKVHGQGDNLCVTAGLKGIYISHDIGKTWVNYNKNTPGFSTANAMTIHCDQNNYYVGTDAGVSISNDNGKTWYTQLQGEKIYGVYGNSREAWAATEHRLYHSPDNGYTWDYQELELGSYTMVFFPVTIKDETIGDYVVESLEESSLSNQEVIDKILALTKADPKNYWGIMGVRRYADCNRLKHAYRQRMTIVHPDKNYNEEAYKIVMNACAELSKNMGCSLKCEVGSLCY